MTVRRPVLLTRMLADDEGDVAGIGPAAVLAASSVVAIVCRLLLPRFIIYLHMSSVCSVSSGGAGAPLSDTWCGGALWQQALSLPRGTCAPPSDARRPNVDA